MTLILVNRLRRHEILATPFDGICAFNRWRGRPACAPTHVNALPDAARAASPPGGATGARADIRRRVVTDGIRKATHSRAERNTPRLRARQLGETTNGKAKCGTYTGQSNQGVPNRVVLVPRRQRGRRPAKTTRGKIVDVKTNRRLKKRTTYLADCL